jgi:hypothetical protein
MSEITYSTDTFVLPPRINRNVFLSQSMGLRYSFEQPHLNVWLVLTSTFEVKARNLLAGAQRDVSGLRRRALVAVIGLTEVRQRERPLGEEAIGRDAGMEGRAAQRHREEARLSREIHEGKGKKRLE